MSANSVSALNRSAVIDCADARQAAVVLFGGLTLMHFVVPDIGIPCPLRRVTGVPCPLCGMTTSVFATIQGRFSDAIAANPAGLAVVVLTLGLFTVARRRESLVVPMWSVLFALAFMWSWELNRFGFT